MDAVHYEGPLFNRYIHCHLDIVIGWIFGIFAYRLAYIYKQEFTRIARIVFCVKHFKRCGIC